MISNALSGPFFDHSRHKLWVRDVDASLDVLAFEGKERLSHPFKYFIEFTSAQHDIDAGKILGKEASFSLHAVPKKLSSGGESVGILAAHNTDIGAGQDITAVADRAVSLLANAELQLEAAQGKVELHALGSNLHALAKTDIKIESVKGRVDCQNKASFYSFAGSACVKFEVAELAPQET